MRYALLISLLATRALADCPAESMCPMPLVSLPPSLGVAWTASRGVMVTSSLTLGVRSGGTPFWLALADVGLAWKPQEDALRGHDPENLAKFEP